MTDERASTPDLLRYLADSTDWLAHRPGDEALDASDELQLIAAMVVATSDTHEPGVYAGPCDICGDELYAKPGARVVHCRLCNVDYDVEPRRQKFSRRPRASSSVPPTSPAS